MIESTFAPIGEYAAPVPPATHAMGRWLAALKERFNKDDPVVAAHQLGKSSTHVLDDLAGPPACGPLIEDLQRTLGQWMADQTSAGCVQVVVLPPCDRSDLLGTWARRHGHQLVDAPARSRLSGTMSQVEDALAGEGLIVIAQLERWFLRDRTGLDAVRSLVALLERSQHRCVIGCNSWAWAFLTKATGAAIVLPKAVSPRPFDQERLSEWLRELAPNDGSEAVTFRMASTGASVLATEEKDVDPPPFMKALASRSLGIPWVAWHLWREVVRTELESDDLEADSVARLARKTQGDQRTVWLADLPEFVLPAKRESDAMLILHSLLIHGELSAEELAATLPCTGEPDLIPGLLARAFVDRDGHRIRVRPAAYPAVREALSAAGYPMDVL